jgi:undecaprenyl diphosphate synthase
MKIKYLVLFNNLMLDLFIILPSIFKLSIIGIFCVTIGTYFKYIKKTKPILHNKHIELNHLAIIMDGNRRYGLNKFNDKLNGHFYGAIKLLEIIEWCIEYKIKTLTVYAFSTENWKRSETEINTLLNITSDFFNYFNPDDKITDNKQNHIQSSKIFDILKYTKYDRNFMINNNLKINFIMTDTDKISSEKKNLIKQFEEKTQDNNGLTLNICLSYGGRSDIIQACKKIATDVKNKELSVDNINENTFARNLKTSTNNTIAYPDLVIRTGGDHRISNFLLWEIAYSELSFVNELFPELSKKQFIQIITDFKNRDRRYGR